MFNLTKFRDRIYHLQFNKQFDLCMAFMRYQETYESSRNSHREKPFTIVEYMKWQSENTGNGKFTYPVAWVGFNLPFYIIGDVISRGISDPNMYDSLFESIYKQVTCVEDEQCYLIGSFVDDSAFDHELTHAQFFVDLNYRSAVQETLQQFKDNHTRNAELLETLQRILTSDGYRDNEYIIDDEINAYLTTGDNGYFTSHKNKKNYRELKSQLMKLWNQYVQEPAEKK